MFYRRFIQVLIFSSCCFCYGWSSLSSFTIGMPGVSPKGTDSYICTAFELETLTASVAYVTKYEALASAEKAHHILLYACNIPEKLHSTWDCRHHAICRDASSILFAWAKNADPTVMPQDTSFKLDSSRQRYLVLQVHYVKELPQPDNTSLTITYKTTPTKYSAGIYLLVRNQLIIPRRTEVTHGDVNCRVRSQIPIYPFAFRTHAHTWGTVITGYKYSTEENKFTEIARGNPQWPQTFYPIKVQEELTSKDFLVARCTFNTSLSDKDVKIGPESGDEMCNLYVMYYTEAEEAPYQACVDMEDRTLNERLPKDSDKPLPPNPLLEEMAIHKSNPRRKGDLDNPSIGRGKEEPPLQEGNEILELSMPGAIPTENDDYRCTSFSVAELTKNRTIYITEFVANARADKAHHVILAHCKYPIKKKRGEIWQCLHHGTCSDSSKIMFAWAKDAPPTTLPPDVGFELNSDEGEYLVLQVHYKHPLEKEDHTGLRLTYTKEKPTYTAGMILMMRTYLTIPPKTKVIHGDINCAIREDTPMHLFAFRTHAHDLGAVITGYLFREGSVDSPPIEIARGDPQKPQTFYPMKIFHKVETGDVLSARCTFDSSNKTTFTRIGATSGDEMCNLYIMFYSKSIRDNFIVCPDEEARKYSKYYPEDSDVRIDELNSISTQGFVPRKDKKGDRNGKGLNSDMYPVPNWPPKDTQNQIGQLSGVCIDSFGNPVIFHRGDRTWNAGTFSSNNVYNGDRNKPISQKTILTLNSTGHVVNAWGQNLFFMPHMITIDKQNNVWVTDVALHQVFKFGPYGGKDFKPLIEMGKPFEPGSDNVHYCKPTAVAVLADGKTFFVSDGYCNSRIIKYSLEIDETGYHKVKVSTTLHWGEANGAGFTISRSPYAFNIPHGLALAEDKNLICVADRENGRVQCFSVDEGKFVKSFQPPEFGSTVYGVAYTPSNGGRLLAVGGAEPFGFINGKKTQGYIMNINTGDLISVFGTGDLRNPHDVAVSEDGSVIYVVELNPYKVWKFTTDGKSPTNNPSLPPQLPPPQPPMMNNKANNPNFKENIEKLGRYFPSTGVTVMTAVGSLLITIFIATCVACRKCRRRGRGTMSGSGVANKKKKKNGKEKKLDLGDLLGRSKEGFQRLKTDDEDDLIEDVANPSSDDDSDLEDFSVPALNT